jgi:lysine 2,3-aminomutase
VVDAPDGGGKIPVMPNYILSQSEHSVALRNYEGYIARYEEPEQYASHNPATCSFCAKNGTGDHRTSVHDLLQGHVTAIKPQAFDRIQEHKEPAPVLSTKVPARSLRRSTNGRHKNRGGSG